MAIKYLECGCCEHYHREDYYGDCRNDAERFTLNDLEKMGISEDNIIEIEPDYDISCGR